MKKTPWFAADVEPARVGVYFKDGYGNTDGYQYWDGKVWWYGGSIEDAAKKAFGRCVKPHPWRGLASDPKVPRNMEQDRHEDDTDGWW